MDNKAQSPFSAIKVVECGEGISAAFGAKMLADLGAEVIKVEPPSGDLARRRGPFPNHQSDPEKSGIFIYLNANKRGVTADLGREEGRELLASLLKGADVLMHNVAPPRRAANGLDSIALTEKYPRLIVTSISMFGTSGPYSNYNGYELTASNAGGWAYLSPGASSYPELPPLKCFGSQADFQGGAHAAITTLAAYLCRIKSGRGQAIDVSEQECITAMLEMNLMHYTYAGRETSRLGQRALGPWFIADCQDGKIFLLTVEEDQWQRLVKFMGNPEWASEELFRDRLSRAQNMDALKALMSEWIAGWKVQDLYREAQAQRIPFAPVNTMQQLYDTPHLAERHFFTEIEQPGLGRLKVPGMPSRYGETPWAIRRPAPRLGEHNDEVFRELGIPAARLDQLKTAGVI
ncbi:MAG: CaiB/BaiF CoA transferase family protein [Candidatus Binataceae bacterium]